MTDLPPTPSSGRRSPRWVKIALAVSLALNLAVAGIVAGIALRGDEGRPRPMAVRDLSFGPFTDALTRDQRRAMLRSFAEDGPGLRETRAQMRSDFNAVLDSLRATPFDPAAFRTAMDGQSARIAARAEAGRNAFVSLVLEMSDADRAAFVARLEDSVKRREEKRDRPPGPTPEN